MASEKKPTGIVITEQRPMRQPTEPSRQPKNTLLTGVGCLGMGTKELRASTEMLKDGKLVFPYCN